MRKRFMSIIPALAFAAVLPTAAIAQSSSSDQAQIQQPDQGVNWKGVGVGAGTLASNVVYIPAKLVYGILGGIAGGAGYALTGGNQQVANTIWRSSLGGDYVVTPDMITGKRPVYFSGPTQTESPSGPGANASGATGSMSGTGSSASGSSYTGSNPAPVTTHPIDNGAGPMGSTLSSSPIGSSGSGTISGSGTSGYSSSAPGAKSASSGKKPSAPDTSIE
jgi:hypothetical protein